MHAPCALAANKAAVVINVLHDMRGAATLFHQDPYVRESYQIAPVGWLTGGP